MSDSRSNTRTFRIIFIGLMAAIACISNYFSIPFMTSRFHIGNAVCVLCKLRAEMCQHLLKQRLRRGKTVLCTLRTVGAEGIKLVVMPKGGCTGKVDMTGIDQKTFAAHPQLKGGVAVQVKDRVAFHH